MSAIKAAKLPVSKNRQYDGISEETARLTATGTLAVSSTANIRNNKPSDIM